MQAIAQADIDGNIDTVQNTSWLPLIPTPSFPAVTSGHRAFSNGGATILASFLGTANISFTTISESPSSEDQIAIARSTASAKWQPKQA